MSSESIKAHSSSSGFLGEKNSGGQAGTASTTQTSEVFPSYRVAYNPAAVNTHLFGPWSGSVCGPACSHPTCWSGKNKARLGLKVPRRREETWADGLDWRHLLKPSKHDHTIQHFLLLNDKLQETPYPGTGKQYFVKFVIEEPSAQEPWRQPSQHRLHTVNLNSQVIFPEESPKQNR